MVAGTILFEELDWARSLFANLHILLHTPVDSSSIILNQSLGIRILASESTRRVHLSSITPRSLKTTFVVAFVQHSAYWIDLALTARAKDQPPEEIDWGVYRMADVYHGVEFTLHAPPR